MRRKLTFCLLIFLFATVFSVAGCNKYLSDSFFVTGNISTDAPLDGVEILVNGSNKNNLKSDADGNFRVDNLRGGDVLSFSKYGYVFKTYSVKGSITGLMVVPSLASFDVSVTYDENLGSVTGCGAHNYLTDAELIFEPAANCRFDGLYDGQTLITSDTSYSFEVTEARSFSAVCTPLSYEISVNKNYPQAKVSHTESALVGGDVELDAYDDDNYVFSKWIVNDLEITSKHYEFVLSANKPTISAVFIKRAAKPTLSVSGAVVSISAAENADGYRVYVDGNLYGSITGDKFDLKKASTIYSGRREISVIAIGAEGYADSSESKIVVDYLRPIDAPADCGIVREGGKVYFTFSKVLSAVGYSVAVDGVYQNLSSYSFSATENRVKIDLSAILTQNKTYAFTVIAMAENSAQNSAETAAVSYTNKLKLAAPTASISGSVLSFSHTDARVRYTIVVEGLIVESDLSAGSLDLSLYVDVDSTIIVIAKLTDYEDNSITLEYIL